MGSFVVKAALFALPVIASPWHFPNEVRPVKGYYDSTNTGQPVIQISDGQIQVPVATATSTAATAIEQASSEPVSIETATASSADPETTSTAFTTSRDVSSVRLASSTPTEAPKAAESTPTTTSHVDDMYGLCDGRKIKSKCGAGSNVGLRSPGDEGKNHGLDKII